MPAQESLAFGMRTVVVVDLRPADRRTWGRSSLTVLAVGMDCRLKPGNDEQV